MIEEDILKLPKASEADIALLIEGTYPLVRGGVGNWIHELIEAFPQYRFAIIFLGSRPEDYTKIFYPILENVVHIQIEFLFGGESRPKPRPVAGEDHVFKYVKDLHESFHCPAKGMKVSELVKQLSLYLVENADLNETQFLYSKRAWEYIMEMYKNRCTTPSFIEYFWTVRNMHIPIWQLAKIVRNVPKIRAFHAISTGYAGFLGSLLQEYWQTPLILTEHGLYTREREIELIETEWFDSQENSIDNIATEENYSRQLWIKFFESFASICYQSANPIVSLFERYQIAQIEAGAEKERTLIIPNGIEATKFSHTRKKRGAKIPRVICFIGRVVPIKDLKTFIRCISLVKREMPEIQGWIVGSMEEDPEYVEECQQFSDNLKLKDNIKFWGEQNIEKIFPKIGLMMISSVSEALPLVILEGFSAGIPIVSTDVGACQELLYGKNPEDEALGKAGAIVGIAEPYALAKAALKLLRDEEAWMLASEAGIKRVERFYRADALFAQYQSIYEKALQ